jgi:hypothetical protein
VDAAIESIRWHDEASARDPVPVWGELRDEHPAFHDEIDDVVVLSRTTTSVGVSPNRPNRATASTPAR